MRTTAFSTVILKFIIYTVLIVSHAEWKSPDSLQMSLVAHFFKLSMVLRYGTYESELDTRKYLLSRQRDHVFRPQSCLLLQYYYILCCVPTPSRRRVLNIFSYFFWSQRLYDVVELSLSLNYKIIACPLLCL